MGNEKKEFQKMVSRYQVGEMAYFQPSIQRIDGKSMTSDDSTIPVLVVGVKFLKGKVLYDVALPNGEGGFYEIHPICNVDSYFMSPPIE